MRIQHNIMAMNSYRNYNNNASALSGNLEKLSSGYKINRAGDDAAGLAISEKMRAQITGLDAAQKNVKDGISLVKTAEGAMQEIQDMLNRMDYLATQSANGTYQNEVDRENLQKEVSSLKEEINRIADSANFNGIKLLDGSLAEGGSSTSVEGFEDIAPATSADSQLAGPEAQAGKWELDLSQLTFNNEGTAKDETIDIKVGGTVVATITLGATGTALGVGDKAFKVEAKTGDLATGGSAGVTVTAKYDESTGKLTISMKDVPTTTANVATGVPALDDLNVEFAAGGTNGVTAGNVKVNINKAAAGADGTEVTLDNTELDKAVQLKTVDDARGPGDKRLYGTATFDISGKIKDGATLKIGNQSYTFAVGAASKFAGGKNVIDLTNYEEDVVETDGELAIAQGITKAFADNKQFHVSFDQAQSGLTFTLLEKEGSGLDYNGSAIVGDVNKTGDATWKGIVQMGEGTISESKSGGLRLQIGDTADEFNQMSVIVGDMHTSALGIDDVDISDQTGAAAAIAKVKDAINNVSSVRGDLGAIQNRLDHTANNLSVMEENIQDAESTIRDTDVADEMMSYVKNNILVQSAQAMLAQANQVPQGVLQLLG